ncbi:hypothetical protein M3J09_004387 [Ascochyta lentis]
MTSTVGRVRLQCVEPHHEPLSLLRNISAQLIIQLKQVSLATRARYPQLLLKVALSAQLTS